MDSKRQPGEFKSPLLSKAGVTENKEMITLIDYQIVTQLASEKKEYSNYAMRQYSYSPPSTNF